MHRFCYNFLEVWIIVTIIKNKVFFSEKTVLILFILLLKIFLLLNLFDAITTYFVVSKCGVFTEKNILVRKFIKKFGVKKGLIYIKLILIIITPAAIWCYIEHALSIIIVLTILDIFYLLVVINNYKICKYIKKTLDKKTSSEKMSFTIYRYRINLVS